MAKMCQPAREALFATRPPCPGRAANHHHRLQWQHLPDHIVRVAAPAQTNLCLAMQFVQEIAIPFGGE